MKHHRIIERCLRTVWIAASFGLGVWLAAATVRGQGVWTLQAQLLLKKCLIAEADGHLADRAPIAYTLERRAAMRGWPVARMVRAYCQYSKAWRPRARAVLLLPRIVDSKYRRWKRVWAELDRWVLKFVAGRIPDPCPRAIHWSGKTDPRPGPSLVALNCGRTLNTFFRWRDDKFRKNAPTSAMVSMVQDDEVAQTQRGLYSYPAGGAVAFGN